jgi:hypothetical protein
MDSVQQLLGLHDLQLEALRPFETYRTTRRHVQLEPSAASQSSHGIDCYRHFGTSVHIYRYKCTYLPAQVYIPTSTSVHIYRYKCIYLPVQVYIPTSTSVHIYRYKTAIFTQLLATQNFTAQLGKLGRAVCPPSAPNTRSPHAEALTDSVASSGTPASHLTRACSRWTRSNQ